jgi:hypothetical protein
MRPTISLTALMLNLTAFTLSLKPLTVSLALNLTALTHSLISLTVSLTLNLTAVRTTPFGPTRFDLGTSDLVSEIPTVRA